MRQSTDQNVQPTDEFVWLGSAIRAAKKHRGLRTVDLCRRSGVSRWTLERIESSRSVPTLQVLAKISIALDLSLSCLLSRPCSGKAA